MSPISLTLRLDVSEPTGSATVRVLFLGKLAELLGRQRSVAIPAAGCALGALRRRLCEGDEQAKEALMRSDVRAALDQVIMPDTAWVRPGCEVAFLPIFSGG